MKQVFRKVWGAIPVRLRKVLIYSLILVLVGTLMSLIVSLLSGQLVGIKGAIAILVDLGLLVWLMRVVRRRWYAEVGPRFKVVLLMMLVILVTLAFAGIEPFSDYKERATVSVLERIKDWQQARLITPPEQGEELAGREVEVTPELEQEVEQEVKPKPELEQEVESEQKSETRLARETLNTRERNLEREQLIEGEVLLLVNAIRASKGLPSLNWEGRLYFASKKHSQAMGEQRSLFHTSVEESYAENAWGGEGYTNWPADTIVESWMGSAAHRTWLLCPHLRNIAVGVTITDTGMYAAWTFWYSETEDADWWYTEQGGIPPDWWY